MSRRSASRPVGLTVVLSRIGDDLVIAGALAAMVFAIAAAFAFFTMFGVLSHRKTESGSASRVEARLAGQSGGAEEEQSA
jgi:hypothetical protein